MALRPHLAAALALPLLLAATPRARSQAADIPSAAPTSTSTNPEQHGRELLDQMVLALGGPAWRNRQTASLLGRSAAFFRGAPTGANVEFAEFFQFPAPASGTTPARPPAERIEFITAKGVIMPGKKRDIVQVWTADQGYELTFKGKSTLPKDQVADYLRRRAHSIDSIIATWLNTPGVIVVFEGQTMVERHPADKVTVLSANNDAVTVELDSATHLPLARTFEWRNEQFKDHDEDREEYSNYQVYSGIQTPLSIFRYRNGDLVNQRFLSKIDYNQPMPPDAFNPDGPLPAKK